MKNLTEEDELLFQQEQEKQQGQEPEQEHTDTPSVWARILAFLKRKKTPRQEEEHVPYTNMANDGARIAAILTMKDLTRVMDDYEAKINTNNGIITNARKMYSDRAEYISRVLNITETVDHKALQEVNAFVDKALANVTKNVLEIPIIKQRVEQLTQSAPQVQTQELPQKQEQTEPQNQDEELKAVLEKMRRESMYTKIAVCFMVLVTIVSLYRYGSARNEWKNQGYEKGVKTMQQKVDNLQQRLASKERMVADYAGRIQRMSQQNSKAEVIAVFDGIKDMKRLRNENARLSRQRKEVVSAYQKLDADYESLRQVTNGYAKTVKEAIGEKAAQAKKVVEVPKRNGPVFNTIASNDDTSPYSPAYRQKN